MQAVLTTEDLAAFEFAYEGICIARPCLGFSWFMEQPLSAFSEKVLKVHDEYFSWVGLGAMRQYASETMSKHRPITKRALTMVPAWFADAASETNSHGIEFSDAEPFNAAPSRKLAMAGAEPFKGVHRSFASLVRFALPAAWGVERPAEMLEVALRLSALLPFQSGSAGYAFECSRYFEKPATEHAWAVSMRHPGLDIHADSTDQLAVRRDGVRGVNWLTLLSHARVHDLGGMPSFAHCKLHELEAGVVIQAGDAPAIGNVAQGDTLAAYREVFKYIEPITPPVFERSPWVHLARDEAQRTQQWYTRFADGKAI